MKFSNLIIVSFFICLVACSSDVQTYRSVDKSGRGLGAQLSINLDAKTGKMYLPASNGLPAQEIELIEVTTDTMRIRNGALLVFIKDGSHLICQNCVTAYPIDWVRTHSQ